MRPLRFCVKGVTSGFVDIQYPVNDLHKWQCTLINYSMKPVIGIALLILSCCCIRVTIDQFGALRNKDYLGAHLVNQKALYDAIKAVNAS